jgi:chromosome segregation ATPase
MKIILKITKIIFFSLIYVCFVPLYCYLNSGEEEETTESTQSISDLQKTIKELRTKLEEKDREIEKLKKDLQAFKTATVTPTKLETKKEPVKQVAPATTKKSGDAYNLSQKKIAKAFKNFKASIGSGLPLLTGLTQRSQIVD